MGFFEGVAGLWKRARGAEARPPVQLAIPRDHVDIGGELGPAFRPDEHYFQVRVNELFSTAARTWWQTHDPMVIVVSEFLYAGEFKAVPFVVGPSITEAHGIRTPPGMLFHDTRVAGLHPYKGGRLNLAVVLYRLERDNKAANILDLAEQAVGAFDFSNALTSYLKVAQTVLDTLDDLLGLDALSPVLGIRYELDPDANDRIEPGFFALIDLPEEQLDRDRLWVRAKRLVEGSSLDSAEPFRRADYVLWSIGQSPTRTDLTTLPFYPVWERVSGEAMKPFPDAWTNAKVNFASLYQTMRASPDLTVKHAQEQKALWQTEMKRLYDEAVADSELGPSDGTDETRKEALSILKL